MSNIGHYRDGATFVTWFLLNGRRWETVSEDATQLIVDTATAGRLALIGKSGELEDVELLLDAALHPVFDIDAETAVSLVTEAQAKLRALLNLPSVVPVEVQHE